MADVFISYARENEAFVRPLAEAVAREGYSVWWDEALPPHLSYSDVITGEIGAARAAIVVWSEAAIASQWVRAEADVARNQGKLVQTSIDGRMPPMPFNQLHFVSIGDWRGEDDHPGWRRVKDSLAALCRGRAERTYAMPAAPPPRPAPAPVPAPAGNPALRTVTIVIGALLLFGLIAAAAFWLTGGQGVPTPTEVQPGSQPRLSAPVEPPPPATARPLPAPPPSQAVAPRPVPVQPRPAAAPPPRPMAVRRYCAGPGRGTPQCRQLRARMSPGR